jgi:hypothetical protein
LASIILFDCCRNSFGLGFLASFWFRLVLVLAALLVNLESVLSFGKGIGIFLIFVGSLGLG